MGAAWEGTVNAASIAILGTLVLGAGYVFYGRYLRDRAFGIEPSRPTPAHQRRDGVDYLPTNRWVLFGHQFASIAGLGPIIGPAIAVVWGWVPAVLWVVFGGVLIGAVHDFAALAVSLRTNGRSIGEVAQEAIGPRAKLLFLLVVFFLLALVLGVFLLAIVQLFQAYPVVIVPVVGVTLLAMAMGLGFYRWRLPIARTTLVAVALMLLLVYIGLRVPIRTGNADAWIAGLLAYGFLASVLPVWLLLQPRDYLNSYKLYIGLFGMFLGVLIMRPGFVAPAIHHAEGVPGLFPLLFITIACGAISGFHSLVSSGTTVRQLDRESDAQMIGYGAMLAESALALLVILACTAGVTSGVWSERYSSWAAINASGAPLRTFVEGGGAFLSQTGLPVDFSRGLIAVIVIAFAMTTLDSATRLLRYNVEEIGKTIHVPAIQNRYVATGLAVASIAYFAFVKFDGQRAGVILWGLFGTTNQLLAALGLLVATLFFFRAGRRSLCTFLPMVFMFVMTLSAMFLNLLRFWREGHWAVFWVGLTVLVLAIWMGFEGAIAYVTVRSRRAALAAERSGIRRDQTSLPEKV